MTISSEVNKSGPYEGDDANTSFAYGFMIYDQADIQVIHTDSTGVETVLTVDVDYTVLSVGSPTGTITYPISGAPLTTGEYITIVRDMTFTQEVDFENQGGFYPEVVELAFDRLVMICQQLEEELDRAVKVDASDTTLPSALLDSINASVIAAAASETAAAASETAAAASAASAAADLVQTDLDTIATAADAVATAADAVATAADRVQTGLDAAATAADLVQTNLDQISCAANAALTAADAASTAADAIATAADAAATAADVVTVAGIYDSFDDRYLGPKASDPALDNDGDPLLTGATYWNTTSGTMKVYSGSAWVAMVDAHTHTTLDSCVLGGTTPAAATVTDLKIDEGIQEQGVSYGTSGSIALNLGSGTLFYPTGAATGAITFSFTNPAASGDVSSFTLEMNNAGTYAPVWPAAVDWPGGTEPTWTTGVDFVTFLTRDGGTTWFGFAAGLGMA